MPRTKRAQTNIEKYGFKDADLTTPGHDAICMWIEDNIQDIVDSLSLFEHSEVLDDQRIGQLLAHYQLTSQENRFQKEGTTETLEGLREKLHQYRTPPIRIDKVVWEPTILNKKDFEVGFLDLLAEVIVPHPLFDLTGDEIEIATKDQEGYKIWFEAKTSIPSLGELFRQLSFYRNHVKDPIVVVSPDTRHKKRIQKQGYHFIEPDVKVEQKSSSPMMALQENQTETPPEPKVSGPIKQLHTLQLPMGKKED